MKKKILFALIEVLAFSFLAYGQNTSSATFPDVWTAPKFLERFNKPINEYRPAGPEAFTFLLVREDGSEMGINNDGIHDASELSESTLSSQSNSIKKAITTLSEDKIKFTGNPDKAIGVIYYKVTYPFYAYYTAAGYSSRISGHSCHVNITIHRMQSSQKTASKIFKNDPGQSTSIQGYSSKFWRNLPEFDNEDMKSLVDLILNTREFISFY